ncbi:MAG: phosphate signaling complex protein PhoU [Acidaminococcales bacterium]|jgi:phosphate transport system protein|nr:phosphate signaling complex protein PhoU [Acidaminococcales bacterium]
MRGKFEEQLSILSAMLTEMGALAETAIAASAEALEKPDAALAGQAIALDQDVDNKTKEIESLCLKLLLHQQPVATDLRLISSVLKMSTDLKRIGNQAVNIAELAAALNEPPYSGKLEYVLRMSEAAQKMVTGCIDAFVHKDARLAEQVIAYDDVVDDLFAKARLNLIELIRKDGGGAEQAINLIMIAKYLERIGDHAVNIAGWIIFYITGGPAGQKEQKAT